jgi:hypothetical protein
MIMQNHDGTMSTEEDSWIIYQTSLAILTAEWSGSRQEERAKEMVNLALRSIFVHTCKCSYMSWNLTTWGLRLCFPLLEGLLQIFTSLKNLLNPRTFCLMASTLNITPPMRLHRSLLLVITDLLNQLSPVENYTPYSTRIFCCVVYPTHDKFSYLVSCPFRCWSFRWGETVSVNSGHQRPYSSSPRW